MTYGFTMDDVPVAEGAANYFLATRKDPRGIIQSMSIKPYSTAALLTQALARTIGDRINIQETQTGVNADYFIIGEQWQVGQKDADLTWLLEPADASAYWVLGIAGFSELGDTTIIGPF